MKDVLLGRQRDRFMPLLPPVLVGHSQTLRQAGEKQPVLVPFRRGQEYAVLTLLMTLQHCLRQEGKKTCFIGPEDSRQLPDEAADDHSWLLVYDKPVDEWMEQAGWSGQSLICVLPEERLRQMKVTAPFQLYQDFAQELTETVQHRCIARRVVHWQDSYEKGSEQLQRLAQIAACTGWLGVAVPALFLCEGLAISFLQLENLVEENPELFTWAEEEQQDILAVTAASGAVARWFVAQQTEEELLAVYRHLVGLASQEEEVAFLFSLLDGLRQHGMRHMARQLTVEREAVAETLACQEDRWGYYQAARLLRGLCAYEQAAQVLEAGREEFPDTFQLEKEKALLLAARGDWEEAEAAFQAADWLQPGDTWLWHHWANAKLQQGELATGLEYLERVLMNIEDTHPSLVYFLISKAEAQRKLRRLQGARETLEMAGRKVQGALQQAYLCHNQGELAWLQGGYREAVHWYEQALGHLPGNPAALNSLAVLWGERGHFKQALSCLQQLLTAQPDNEYGILTLASLYRRQRNLSENQRDKQIYGQLAEESLQKLEVLHPDTLPLLSEKMALFVAKGEGDRVEEAFQALCKNFPRQMRSYANKAEWCFKKGQLEEAEKYIDFALKHSGGFQVVLANSKAKFLACQDMALARQYFSQILSQTQELTTIDRIIVYNTWAAAEQQYGDAGQGKFFYEQALALDEENAYTCEQYGRWLEGQGEKEKGREYRNRARQWGLFLAQV